MNKFYNDTNIEDTVHSKEKAYSAIKALKEHLYGSKTAIERIEKLKNEIQKTTITYDIL